MALFSLQDLLDCLELERLADGGYAARNLPMDYRRLFGGQLLAQAIVAAARSAEGKRVKSIHACFPQEGEREAALVYRVEALQDGRSFSTRWIRALQGERNVLSALVSLHVEEEGLSHQLEAPAVGAPQQAALRELDMIPWETRCVGDVDLDARTSGPPRFEFWMRAPALPADPALHQALFAHASDLTLIATALRPHAGLGQSDAPERIATAVTSHTLWFHRPLRLDDWLLVTQSSPSAAGARGFGLGHAFGSGPQGPAAQHVASFAQECLLRLR